MPNSSHQDLVDHTGERAASGSGLRAPHAVEGVDACRAGGVAWDEGRGGGARREGRGMVRQSKCNKDVLQPR